MRTEYFKAMRPNRGSSIIEAERVDLLHDSLKS